mgnify:CR=1 FL=1
MELITSRRNPLVGRLRALHQGRGRRETAHRVEERPRREQQRAGAEEDFAAGPRRAFGVAGSLGVMGPLRGRELVGDGRGGEWQGEADEGGEGGAELKHGALDASHGAGISAFTQPGVLGTLPRTNIAYAHHSGAGRPSGLVPF